MATQSKKKFITVKPKTEEAEELFEYSMLGIQSCELLEKTDVTYLLKPVRANYTFVMKITGDPNWEVDK
jgi:hypothetical protein